MNYLGLPGGENELMKLHVTNYLQQLKDSGMKLTIVMTECCI